MPFGTPGPPGPGLVCFPHRPPQERTFTGRRIAGAMLALPRKGAWGLESFEHLLLVPLPGEGEGANLNPENGEDMTEPVRSMAGMIAGMSPRLQEGEYVFCTSGEDSRHWKDLHPVATFREAEGTSMVIERKSAELAGFDLGSPMRMITLEVHSALDGVGLTAAVAGALGAVGIPCNMVAAYHHDHVFVPAGLADAALRVLLDLQREAQT